jgi:hypothetical protein
MCRHSISELFVPYESNSITVSLTRKVAGKFSKYSIYNETSLLYAVYILFWTYLWRVDIHTVHLWHCRNIYTALSPQIPTRNNNIKMKMFGQRRSVNCWWFFSSSMYSVIWVYSYKTQEMNLINVASSRARCVYRQYHRILDWEMQSKIDFGAM